MRRGMEGIEQLKKQDFEERIDKKTGRKYVTKIKDELTKNHRGSELEKDAERGVMPEFVDDRKNCPVRIWKKYLAHLNPDEDSLWQVASSKWAPHLTVWYTRKKIGKNQFGSFMRELSTTCGLSQQYQNHDCRATGISILSRLQYPTGHIMSATGQKSAQTVAR